MGASSNEKNISVTAVLVMGTEIAHLHYVMTNTAKD
jgi:hypothetical protein